MYKCICGKAFETKKGLNGHKAKCHIYQSELFKLMKKHFTIEFLEWWYYNKHETSYLLCVLFNKKYPHVRLNPSKLILYCNKYGIKTPDIKQANNSPHNKRIRHEHNNLAKNTPGYLKRQQKLAEEGITNVFQRESVKSKIKQTMLEKYGVTNTVYLNTYKSNNGIESKPHLKVLNFLDEYGLIKDIDYISEPRYLFNHFNEDLGKDFCPRPDIYLPKYNIVIEIYGDRWHANPKLYSDDQIIHLWKGDKTAKQIHIDDQIREHHFVKYFNCNLYIIWEDDIKHNIYQEPLKQYLDELFKNQINQKDSL